jgi:hypothetical protein
MEIQDTLSNFYITLKKVEKHLHFVFVTGISTLALTSIYSGLDNLYDITREKGYTGICGFTKAELIDNFHPLFDNLLSSLVNSGVLKKGDDHKALIKSILDKYDGYSWGGSTKVLNPFSINKCFADNKLDNYCFDAGPPLLLEHAMSQNPTAYLQCNWDNVLEDDVDKIEIGDLRPISVLFQTGYLTIDALIIKTAEIHKTEGSIFLKSENYYSLKIPNNEVLHSYTNVLFKNLFPLLSDDDAKVSCRNNITNSIKEINDTELSEILEAHLARIPYTQDDYRTRMWKFDPKQGEIFFQAVFLHFFVGLGLRVIPESISSRERSGIDIFIGDNTYVVFELKYLPKESKKEKFSKNIEKAMDKMADEAISQAFSQVSATLQNEEYKNKASKIITAGIVIYDRDIVFDKFADNGRTLKK